MNCLTKQATIISVGSGKGGTGKSFFSYLLATNLARSGRKVLLFDGDLGCANLHTLCGAPKTLHTLSDFFTEKRSLEEIAFQTSTPNLSLISGAADSLTITNLSYVQKTKLLHHLENLPYDFIVIDVGPEISYNSLDFYILGDCKFLVLNPEQVSLENCYRFLKAALLREFALSVGVKKSRSLFHDKVIDPFSNVQEMYQYMMDKDKGLRDTFRKVFNETEFYIVLNKEFGDESAVARSFEEIVEKYLTVNINYLGSIPFDVKVIEAYKKTASVNEIENISAAASKISEKFLRIL